MSRRAFVQGALVCGLGIPRARAATDGNDPSALRFMKLRHASLLIEIAGRRVLVDPWLTRGPGGGLLVKTGEPAVTEDALGSIDILLVTSSSVDRLDVATLRALPEKGARCFVADERAASVCRAAGFNRVRVVGVDDHWRILDLEIHTFACRAAGLLPASIGFHLEGGGRRVLLAGSLLPLVVDDGVGRFARAHPAEIVFLPRPHRALAPGDLAASDDDLILVARLARARAVVPIADAVEPGPLAAPLVDAIIAPRAVTLMAPDDVPSVSILDDKPSERVRMPRAIHVEPGVWYRLAVDGVRSSDVRKGP